MAHIISALSESEVEELHSTGSTIGAYILFPSNRIDMKPTINGARGMSHAIGDRFDLTLECIRRHYLQEASPLETTLQRYASFFALFDNFQGYVDFFLLQDLVTEDYQAIRFYLPFDDFKSSPLPSSVSEYRTYQKGVLEFIENRNGRIDNR
ncbi:MAG: hypothetical protein AAFY35_12110 [Pseudomonadota bacterium]